MLLHKLDKMNVTLNDDGTVDYSKVPFPYIRQSLEKMDRLIRIALMERDLKFEYPHLTEKLKIKGDMLKIVNAEESKLQKMKIQKEFQKEQESELNYEQYFGTFTKDQVQDIEVR